MLRKPDTYVNNFSRPNTFGKCKYARKVRIDEKKSIIWEVLSRQMFKLRNHNYKPVVAWILSIVPYVSYGQPMIGKPFGFTRAFCLDSGHVLRLDRFDFFPTKYINLTDPEIVYITA